MVDTLTEEVAAGPVSPSPSRRGLTVAGPLMGVLVALWLLVPVFGPRPPAGEDVMAHLVRADFGIAHLVARGRLDGWFPRFVLGHQEFLFNGPGLTWLMAIPRALTFGALSNTGALKVVYVASVVAIPPAMWFLARSYRLGRRVAGIAAVLALWVSSPFGPGLGGLFRVGLVSHQVGAVLFCLALGALLRSTTDRRPRFLIGAAVALAALVVTHLISALILAVVVALTLAILAAVRQLSWPGFGRTVTAGVVAAGLAGFWVVPFLAHRDLRGVVTTWGTPPLGDRLADIATGKILFPAGLGLVVAGGWAYQLTRLRGRPEATAWVALPVAYLAVAHGSLALLGGNEVTLQLANRGLGYAGLIAILAVAAVGSDATRRFGTAGHLAVLAVVGVVALNWAPGRDAVGQLPEPKPALRAAAGALARLVPDGARFATQRDFPGEIARTGVIHPETWLARVSGRNSLNGFNLESSSTPGAGFEPDRLDEAAPITSARRLSRLGVTHVVTTTDALFEDLAASPRFTPVWRSSPLAILALRPEPGRAHPASLISSADPVEALLVTARPEHLVFAVEAAEPLEVTVAVAWSPKWHARIDGRQTVPGRTADGLIEAQLPAGTSRLQLDYQSDIWDRVGVAVTLLTMGGGAAVLRRRGRSQPMSSNFSRTA